MTTLRILGTLLFIMLAKYHAFSQQFFTDGFVVTIEKDTLSGQLRLKDNVTLEFRERVSGSLTTYAPEHLRSFRTDEGNGVVASLTEQGQTKTYFLLEGESGYVSLFRLPKAEGRLAYALRLPDNTFRPLRGTLSVGVLKEVLTECNSTLFATRLLPSQFYYQYPYFEKIVRAYNECVRPQQKTARPRKKGSFEIGITGGLAANSWLYGATESRFNPYWSPNGVYPTQLTFTAGAFYTLAARRKFSVTIEAFYSSYTGSRTFFINNPLDPSDPRTRTYRFSETYIRLPISARYMFLTKPFKAYIKAGFAPVRALTIEGSYSDQLVTNASLPMRPSLSAGYLVGAGLGIPVSLQKTIYLEARFVPHIVSYAVTRLANSRSFQLTASVPLLSR